MIPAITQIWLVAGVTDMRRGFTSLSGLVQSALDKSPLSGHVFIFRGRRGDLIKLIWHDGDGSDRRPAAEPYLCRVPSCLCCARALI
jgi:transposase